VRLPKLRERGHGFWDFGGAVPGGLPGIHTANRGAIKALADYPVTTMAKNESFRYPWTLRSVEELAAEMERARVIHGRIGLCGWYCTWLPGPRRVVMWNEAAKLVEGPGRTPRPPELSK
jgi:hypothetical protein